MKIKMFFAAALFTMAFAACSNDHRTENEDMRDTARNVQTPASVNPALDNRGSDTSNTMQNGNMQNGNRTDAGMDSVKRNR